jgi:hypothetical protein
MNHSTRAQNECLRNISNTDRLGERDPGYILLRDSVPTFSRAKKGGKIHILDTMSAETFGFKLGRGRGFLNDATI